ncbi:hypothetical protein NXW89_10155 [Bacteroides thetaiotaomicron]|nr:hypothetical protein [Bacteroides thetaiotaomicron]
MLKIKTNKGYLDLGGDFTVQIDEKIPCHERPGIANRTGYGSMYRQQC